MSHYAVYGRRWFQKLYGNTYHSVKVYKDGELIGKEDFDYGYGNHYAQCAMVIICKDDPTISQRLGFNRTVNHLPPLWQITELGHTLIDDVVNVQRKKDL